MNSAKRIYRLDSNKNYLPGHGVIDRSHEPIKALHCIFPPSNKITFKTIENQTISMPKEAFVAGAIYPYSIIQINEEGAKCFIGISY